MNNTTLKGVGTGSSCSLATDDLDLIAYLDSLPDRGYGKEWARLMSMDWMPLRTSWEISSEAALSDLVQVAVKGAPIPKAPVGGKRPRGGYPQNLIGNA